MDNLINVMFSERRKAQKNTYCMIVCTSHSKTSKTKLYCLGGKHNQSKGKQENDIHKSKACEDHRPHVQEGNY